MKILLVEDEKGLILTLTDRLRSEGFDVEAASDGEAGLNAAKSEGFDLIILDVMLPKKERAGRLPRSPASRNSNPYLDADRKRRDRR